MALPFGQVVPEEKKDKYLKEKLREEITGIFAWMVRGYLDYAHSGLVLAPIIKEAIAAYREEQDLLKRFFADNCEFGTKAQNAHHAYEYSVGREAFYSNFRNWREKQHLTLMNETSFKNEIKTRFKDRIEENQIRIPKSPGSTETKQVWHWVGVRVVAKY